MAVTKENVALEGILRGVGLERTCHIRAVRQVTYADEALQPVAVSYSRFDIEDSDDFPDGEYELEFDSHHVPVIKSQGRYSPRLTDSS